MYTDYMLYAYGVTKKPSQCGLHSEQAPEQLHALLKNDSRATSDNNGQEDRRDYTKFTTHQ